MQYFKEDRNGVSEVCTLVEEFAEKRAEDRAKERVIDIAKVHFFIHPSAFSHA